MLRGLDQQMEKKEDGGLYFMDRIWVPLMGDVRTIIMDETYAMRYSIHPGANKMYYDLRDMYWWPGMKKDIATYVSRCLICSKVKLEHRRPSGLLQQPKILEWKWDKNTMDFITKLSSSSGGHDTIWIMKKTMKRYRVNHRFSTSYHPQTSGQVENMNIALKRILEKTVKDNLAIWSRKLDDALWAFRTAYKTPTETTPYKLIYGKNCHLPFEIEHRAYWVLKNYNPDLIAIGEKRMFQLHELDELRHQSYENYRLYKARTKVWHDRKLKIRKEFKHEKKVLLFHSKYKFKQPKLRSRRQGPYVVKHQYPSGYVDLYGKDGTTFIVNGHRLKLYHEEEDYNDQREAVTPFFQKE
ncbi:reverse transcriptase domain-containing protein [Tanacetum coccineum]